MLRVTSILQGCSIQAKDGKIGSVYDILFGDQSWKIMWLVVDTGGWLTGRKVLIHPSAIGETDGRLGRLYVDLTKQQIADSPGILDDPPVSRQVEQNFGDSYMWDPVWGGQGFAGDSVVSPLTASPSFAGDVNRPAMRDPRSEDQDPHLRSAGAVTGYHIHAVDGDIGHLHDFLIDDESWEIRNLIVDTKNWFPGPHVLLPPRSVVGIDWLMRLIELNVTCEHVKNSPPAW